MIFWLVSISCLLYVVQLYAIFLFLEDGSIGSRKKFYMSLIPLSFVWIGFFIYIKNTRDSFRKAVNNFKNLK